jgi:DNA invertase Pin-like site-specific DNA recombinase
LLTLVVAGLRFQPDTSRSGADINGQRVGYTRVSTLEQSTDRQLDGIDVGRTFADHVSGNDLRRPQLEALLEFVRDGDTVVVHSMDRLARNLDDLRATVRGLTTRGVRVEFVKEQLTFTGEDTAMATLLLSVMGAFAEFERALIRERQREGIALAKQRGAYRGRRKALTSDQVSQLHAGAADGRSKAELAREFGISRETVYQYLRIPEAADAAAAAAAGSLDDSGRAAVAG